MILVIPRNFCLRGWTIIQPRRGEPAIAGSPTMNDYHFYLGAQFFSNHCLLDSMLWLLFGYLVTPWGVLRCNQNLQLTDPRWVGTGRTIFNNKDEPVKQYEPFFSPTHSYEDEADLVESGVTPIIHYDPLARVIRTDLPNGTFSKVELRAVKSGSGVYGDTQTHRHRPHLSY